jgi:hypothetical protein
MAAHFDFWRRHQRQLAADLRDEPRLIHLQTEPDAGVE